MDYNPWFGFWESEKGFENRIPSERASPGEQNGTNFSFVAPSSEYFGMHDIVLKAVVVYIYVAGAVCRAVW